MCICICIERERYITSVGARSESVKRSKAHECAEVLQNIGELCVTPMPRDPLTSLT